MTIQDLDYKFREEYTKGELHFSDLLDNPFDQFENWFEEISKVQTHAQNAMVLSTVNKQGRPSSRVVLLKHFDENGLVFFTNYSSHKAIDINENPQVAVTFFSPELEREIRVEGVAKKVSEEISINYSKSRPFESQVAAYISKQSKSLKSRDQLEDEYFNALKEFKGKAVPTDNAWGGFQIIPDYFEFWQGREHRLHDRFVYKLENGQWVKLRLYP